MALEAMASGAIKPEKLLTKVYPIKDAEAAIKHAGTRKTLKIQLNMEDGYQGDAENTTQHGGRVPGTLKIQLNMEDE